MRIFHIANEVVSTGNGISNSAVDLACVQSELGFDVSFISSGGGYIDLLQHHKVNHYSVNLYMRSGLSFLGSINKLGGLMQEYKPDIVHAHTMTAAVLMRVGRDFAKFGQYGLITTVHNEWRSSSNLMNAGDRVIVLSESGRRAFESRGFAKHKLHVICHGILQSPRRRTEILAQLENSMPDDRQIIATVAGLYKRKGIGDLICAFGKLAETFTKAELHIIGWGPDEKYLRKLASESPGSERIHFRGFIAKPYKELKKSSIFVLASHTEAFPLAVAEAREAGCAIIATTVGGVPELLEQGRAGILIPPHQPDVLAEALRRLLGDRAELEKWRSAACSNLNWLSCKRMADQTIELYRSLLQSR
ncbi:glycosyltransferase family 4 protein [Methylobacterium komagatae]|uniref:Glycosyltransferase family 4 protein n=1 Tax=Methylobacterium komagatae TaxID=374425 RepID=A0ABW2BR12_9HYPH